MLDREQLKEVVLEALRPYGVKRIALFGSFARGEETPESDIDLLVLFEKPRCRPLSLLTWVQIEEELSRRLKRPVELVSERALSPYIRPHVEKEMVVLYESESR